MVSELIVPAVDWLKVKSVLLILSMLCSHRATNCHFSFGDVDVVVRQRLLDCDARVAVDVQERICLRQVRLNVLKG
jgi:hypothetical protein